MLTLTNVFQTPATCANVALHNLYPKEIDLVVSFCSPLSRRHFLLQIHRSLALTLVATHRVVIFFANISLSSIQIQSHRSAAFALSSGTVGAAMSASLSKVRSIALSYGIVIHPTPNSYLDCAHNLAGRIINHLWCKWGSDDCGLRPGEVDLYSVNIPLIEELLAEGSLKIHWTTLWRNSYGSLFEDISGSKKSEDRTIMLAVSDVTKESRVFTEVPEPKIPKTTEFHPLSFKWSPDIDHLIYPSDEILPVGSDGWAIYHGWASVTPLRAAFAESCCTGTGSEWNLEL